MTAEAHFWPIAAGVECTARRMHCQMAAGDTNVGSRPIGLKMTPS